MKKTLTIYSALFLFAFTFAFAFTLATPAQAEPLCCVLAWCPGSPPTSALDGWTTYDPITQELYCNWDPENHPECAMAYPCDET